MVIFVRSYFICTHNSVLDGVPYFSDILTSVYFRLLIEFILPYIFAFSLNLSSISDHNTSIFSKYKHNLMENIGYEMLNTGLIRFGTKTIILGTGR